jgi:phage-related minor tail protein
MASTKVRGITIELGGDTSGLRKALTEVNTEIGKTQKDLKDVERLLKLDPGNTELLAQKQRLLNDRIGETKTKLDALKTAQSQVDLSTEEGQRQYDALTREIASCEQELKNLETQAGKSNVAVQKIAAAGDKLKNVGSKVSGIGDSMTRNVTVPIVGAGTAIVKTAGDFEQQMAKVSGIAQAYGDDLDALKEKAMELSGTTQFSATEIAQAYEYMGMAGWNTNQILAGTPGIINLATASGEDLASVSDIVTDGLTAFGLKAEDTSRFVNVLAEAARSSNTNVGMMGESFKYVGPVAGAMGYSIEDVATALGLMANSGIKSSMAGTSLRNMMQRMAKPTKESAMAMKRLGLSVADDSGKMYSFDEIIQQIRKSMGEINMPLDEYNRQLDQLDAALEDGTIKQSQYDKELEELNKQAFGAEGAEKARAAAMLGGTRAMAGLMAISEATEEDYNNLKDAIKGSSDQMVLTADGSVKKLNDALADGDEIIKEYDGTAAAMAGTMNETTNVQMKQLMNQLQVLAIQLGETLLPIVQDVVNTIDGWVKGFQDLDPETQDMIVKIGLVVAALGPLLSVGGRLLTGIGTLMTHAPAIAGAFSTIATFITGTAIPALGSLVGAIAPVIAAAAPFIAVAALVVAAGILVVKNWDEIKEAAKLLVERTKEHWEEFKKKFEELGQKIAEKVNDIKQKFSDMKQGIADRINDVKNKLNEFKQGWEEKINAIKTKVEDFKQTVSDKFNSIKDSVVKCFEGIKNGIKSPINAALGFVEKFINNMIDGFNKLGSKIGSLEFDVPDWVPGDLGGKHFKLGLPELAHVSLPRLASGGIMTNGSAIVGEAGPELLTARNGQAIVQPLGGQNGADELTGLLETYLPYLALRQNILLDGKALVGQTAATMNEALGQISNRSRFA